MKNKLDSILGCLFVLASVTLTVLVIGSLLIALFTKINEEERLDDQADLLTCQQLANTTTECKNIIFYAKRNEIRNQLGH